MERYEFVQRAEEKLNEGTKRIEENLKNINNITFQCLAITIINIVLLMYVLWRI